MTSGCLTVRVSDCRHGRFCYMPNDVFIGRAMERYGEYSEEEVRLLRRLIDASDVVVEVGANSGTITVPLARVARRVIAVEPQRIIHQQLCANVALNGLTNVETMHAACGDEAGTAMVPDVNYLSLGNFGGVSTRSDGDGDGEVVRVVTVDSLGVIPSLVKVDAEGHELEILRGADRTIASCRPVLYVECDRRECADALIEHLLGLRYELWRHTPRLFNPGNWRGCSDNFYGPMVSINLLCIPKERDVRVSGLKNIGSVSEWN